MARIIKEPPVLTKQCGKCERIIRYCKDDLTEEFDGRENWTHLVCPGCGYDNLNPIGKPEAPAIPSEVMEAGERIARHRKGRTSKEVWGKAGVLGYHDDLKLVAEYFLRGIEIII